VARDSAGKPVGRQDCGENSPSSAIRNMPAMSATGSEGEYAFYFALKADY
jgi:hypothetical protein